MKLKKLVFLTAFFFLAGAAGVWAADDPAPKTDTQSADDSQAQAPDPDATIKSDTRKTIEQDIEKADADRQDADRERHDDRR